MFYQAGHYYSSWVYSWVNMPRTPPTHTHTYALSSMHSIVGVFWHLSSREKASWSLPTLFLYVLGTNIWCPLQWGLSIKFWWITKSYGSSLCCFRVYSWSMAWGEIFLLFDSLWPLRYTQPYLCNITPIKFFCMNYAYIFRKFIWYYAFIWLFKHPHW